MQKQYPDLINQYEDLFLRSQHKFAKDYGELSLYFYNFKERPPTTPAFWDWQAIISW
jgi:hypothetical protein